MLIRGGGLPCARPARARVLKARIYYLWYYLLVFVFLPEIFFLRQTVREYLFRVRALNGGDIWRASCGKIALRAGGEVFGLQPVCSVVSPDTCLIWRMFAS